MSMRYKGGVISATAPTTSTSAASGVWTIPQQLQALVANKWPPVLPAIGSVLGGGFFAGQISTAGNGIATHNLIVGPKSTAQNAGKQWKIVDTSTAGTSSVIDGPANSTAMNDVNHPAAQFCEGLTIGGFSDWYMPAKNELEVCYYNLKPSTTNNNTSSGINANAVPARASNYTTGTPAQTSAVNFQTGGAEAWNGDVYWSSTEFSSTQGWVNYMKTGNQYGAGKTFSLLTRAIRRVPV